MGGLGCVPRWLLGLIWERLRASALIVHQHTEIAAFRLFGAIAFPRSFNKSVLRGFLGGFFGFMGARCIFGCLVAFVGLVGLYACNVRRLEIEKRNAAIFVGFAPAMFVDCFALAVACVVFVASLALIALFLVFVGCVGCVVGGSFSLRMIATKRKGAPRWRSLSLFVGCGLVICS